LAATKSKKPALAFLATSKKVSLAETIADTIAQAIADRNLNPGERIVEVALAERLNVSRVPVREALKILSTQGVLQEGRQSYEVPPLNEETAKQVQEARTMLETLLLRDAIHAWRTGEAGLDGLDMALLRMQSAAKVNDADEFRRSDLAFHREISRAAGNEIVRTLWETVARHTLIVLNVPRHRNIDLMALAEKHVSLRAFIADQIEMPGNQDDVLNALRAHFLAQD
jgi:DNA-binding GntR family transcriptional regulator